MNEFKHGLGDRVQDVVTGLKGIVMTRAEHVYGCNRYWVQPEEVKDGKAVEGQWWDEDQLKLVRRGVVAASVPEAPPLRVAAARPGGAAGQPSSRPQGR